MAMDTACEDFILFSQFWRIAPRLTINFTTTARECKLILEPLFSPKFRIRLTCDSSKHSLLATPLICKIFLQVLHPLIPAALESKFPDLLRCRHTFSIFLCSCQSILDIVLQETSCNCGNRGVSHYYETTRIENVEVAARKTLNGAPLTIELAFHTAEVRILRYSS